MQNLLAILAVIGTSSMLSANAIEPKVVATPVTQGTPLGRVRASGKSVISHSSTFIGFCSPTSPFTFTLTGESGVGAIGVATGQTEPFIDFVEPQDFATLEISGPAQPNFPAFEAAPTDGVIAFPFQYKDATAGEVVVGCSDETTIVVIAKDDSNFEVEASIDDGEGTGISFTVPEGVRSKTPLVGRGFAKKGQGAAPVGFEKASKRGIVIKYDPRSSAKGVAIVDALVQNGKGQDVIRSFVFESSPTRPKSVRDINFKCCDIDEQGDLLVDFPSLSKAGQTLKVDIRVGLSVEGQEISSSVVDVSAYLRGDGQMSIHGGWLRLALEEHGLANTKEGWDVFIEDVVVTDPEAEYEVIGRMGKATASNGIRASQRRRKPKSFPNHRRRKSAASARRCSPEGSPVAKPRGFAPLVVLTGSCWFTDTVQLLTHSL